MTAGPADAPVPPRKAEAPVAAFAGLDLRIGTVRSAAPNPKARRPALVLEVDLGPLGVVTSSAQITDRYAAADLVGRQVAVVVNFPPLRVAGVKSEALVLGGMPAGGVVLLTPDAAVPDGTPVG